MQQQKSLVSYALTYNFAPLLCITIYDLLLFYFSLGTYFLHYT